MSQPVVRTVHHRIRTASSVLFFGAIVIAAIVVMLPGQKSESVKSTNSSEQTSAQQYEVVPAPKPQEPIMPEQETPTSATSSASSVTINGETTELHGNGKIDKTVTSDDGMSTSHVHISVSQSSTGDTANQ